MITLAGMGGPRRVLRRGLLALAGLVWALASGAGAVDDKAAVWRERFEQAVDRRLELPIAAQRHYEAMLDAALADGGLGELPPQAVVMVDRSVNVQAAFVLLRTPAPGWFWLGAAPVSTGQTGRFDHFRTPLGVFSHDLDNPDFRAEGTYNENHIRGYGVRGMRVFDFGWVQAERGWGAGGRSAMRLQMHATDPDVLEPRLGRVASKGCIRIPATLNRFLDRHGLLDADYAQALARGETPWVLPADREPFPLPGRYLGVVDSGATVRPDWAALRAAGRAPGKAAPARPARRGPAPLADGSMQACGA